MGTESESELTIREAELRIEAALNQGENDARLLDARDFDPKLWDEARAALGVLVTHAKGKS